MQNKPNCSACAAAIIWRVALPTEKNPNPKPNCFNPLPNAEKGNARFIDNQHYEILTKEKLEAAKQENEPLYLAHWSTCPQAGKFRRKK